MKSRILYAIVFIALFFAPAALKAQMIISHSEKDSCDGDYDFNITTSNLPNLTYKSYYGDGNSHTGNISLGQAKYQHHYSLPGTYSIKHVLFSNNVAVDSVQFSVNSTLCSNVHIRIFKDLNANCIYDPSDLWASLNCTIQVDSASINVGTYSIYNSRYIRVTQGKTYTFKIVNVPASVLSTCSPSGITLTIPTTTNNILVDLGLNCNPAANFDLKINSVGGMYRPVGYSYVQAWGTNIDACSGTNSTITVNFDNTKFNYHSANPTPVSVIGNAVTFNFNNLSSSNPAFGKIIIYPKAPLSFTIGDTICASASITPTVGDINVSNNNKTGCNKVIASWDPNSKTVTPEGAIMPGTQLEYTINFENLGNDTAFNIHILDTLSDKLDFSSFKFIESSHHATTSMFTGSNGIKILKFDFVDIKLADSTHPESNSGLVTFSIKAKTGLVPLTQIENRAGIYFDINPVVMTNTALNWIQGLSVDGVNTTKPLHIYPNPNDGEFIIKADTKQYNSAKLMNSLGQVVATQALSAAETRMNVKALPAGIYYMLLTGPAGSTAERIEKQ